jgi:(1->4)-alpha-D-glucan 1-alpha-D-glucosylmutase
VISELPVEWRRHVSRWARINAGQRTEVDKRPAPDRNDEYRFYQVLLGVWPPSLAAEAAAPPQRLVDRLREYMMKAIKEAKIHTSWINDNQAYDAAMARFVEGVLRGPSWRRFLASFAPFQARVARLAVGNSLAQVVLKVGSPGVPDFYQGTELWDLHLVDPDNRQPVDFAARRSLLDRLAPLLPDLRAGGTAEPPGRSAERLALIAEMSDNWGDGRIKLWVTAAGLRARRERPDLFLRGDYLPLSAAGSRAGHLFAFARRASSPGAAALVIVPRLVSRLGEGWRDWASAWADTSLALPPELAGRRWLNAITGEVVEPEAPGGARMLAASVLAHSPVAILIAL